MRIPSLTVRFHRTLASSIRKPVADKTCPRHVLSRPSNPFRTNRKDRQKPVFLFGGEGSLPSVSHTLLLNVHHAQGIFQSEKTPWDFLLQKLMVEYHLL